MTDEELDGLATLCTNEALYARVRSSELAGLISAARRWAKAEAFLKEHGEVLKGSLSLAGDAAEDGLFPNKWKRIDAAHDALVSLISESRQ